MRKGRPSPRPFPLPRRSACPTRGRRALWRPASKKEGRRRAVGQSGPRKTVSNHPGGQHSLRPGCPKPGQEALGKGGSEARATLGGRLVDSSGPRAKGPRPRAPEPGRPTPWEKEDPGGHPHGGEHFPGLPLPTRRAPTNTSGPPPRNPPGRDGLGAGEDTRVTFSSGRPRKASRQEPSGPVEALSQRQGGPSGGGEAPNMHHRRSTKPDRQFPHGRPGREKSDQRRGRRALRQLNEEGNRKRSTGRRVAAPESPGEKSSSFTGFARHGRSLAEKKNGTPGGNSHHTLEKPPEARGKRDRGPGTEKGPRFTTGGTRSPHFGRSRPALIQGNRSWASEGEAPGGAPPWFLQSTGSILTKLGSASKEARASKAAARRNRRLGSRELSARERNPAVEEGLLSPVHPGATHLQVRNWAPGAVPPDDRWQQAARQPSHKTTGGGIGAQVNRTEEEGGSPKASSAAGRGEVHLEGTSEGKRRRKGPGGQEARGGSPRNRRVGPRRAHPFPVGAHQRESSPTTTDSEGGTGEREAGDGDLRRPVSENGTQK
ncbi:hypothetical protein GWK47_024487 [Chionoecetes opilio]|uniref:Uncharacterized protein n=1 Tax=Chionoecetes opilio TaxID=41210 RepID=A0A8J4XLS1_CHIOP|nr:hypothetical protein GWK47_024487 [Chionoecetes opilio]